MHQLNGMTSPWRYWKAVTGDQNNDTEQSSDDFSLCKKKLAWQNCGQEDSDR